MPVDFSLALLWDAPRTTIPSPTTNWYSGPEGCDRMLCVSIIGGTAPLATAELYAATDGYRGGGGSTLSCRISGRAVQRKFHQGTHNMAGADLPSAKGYGAANKLCKASSVETPWDSLFCRQWWVECI